MNNTGRRKNSINMIRVIASKPIAGLFFQMRMMIRNTVSILAGICATKLVTGTFFRVAEPVLKRSRGRRARARILELRSRGARAKKLQEAGGGVKASRKGAIRKLASFNTRTSI